MAENTQIKRMTAKFVDINEINKGTFVKRTGWDPSGVLTNYGEISRVNLTGLIVSIDQEENITTVIIDDGTGNIQLRAFEEIKSELKVGEIIRVIGKIRENNGSMYIVPEIIKPVSKEWYKYHGLRLKLQKLTSKKLPIDTNTGDKEEIQTGPSQTIINAISILDKGSGVDIDEIVNNIKITGSEDLIRALIEEGEVFEVSPGRVKLLE
jgi:RPA family protein